VVQENRFLHVRSNQPEIGNLCVAFLREPPKFVAEAAGETLRLAPGELERRVFGRMPVSRRPRKWWTLRAGPLPVE
jgi:hypothetical protein